MKVLVTGGAGFIGSHTCVELLQAGHQVVIYDNFCMSHPQVVDRIARIAGSRPMVVKGDVRDRALVEQTLRDYAIDSVIHFAGLKAVGESVEKPLEYYDCNVIGSLSLFEAMAACQVHTLLFSSSATVYGVPQKLPLTEDHPLSALNPYGQTKLTVENILRDMQRASPLWQIGILRYFNPVGAHETGLIGEDPVGIPNNLVPFVAQVAVGKRAALKVWGNDYETPDGTGVRDYIHVVDLARGHLKALQALADKKTSFTVNLGTGRGYSVLEVVQAFAQACGRPIPYEFAPRRPGDIASCYADPASAKALLGWTASFDLDRMCQDSWRWQSQNPNGYC